MISNKKHYAFIGFLSLPFIILFLLYLSFISIDSKYSKIINDEAESMTLIQKLTEESINNYFVIRNILITSDAAEKKEMEVMWHKNNEHINSYLDSLSRVNLIQMLNNQTLNYLTDARKVYVSKCLKFFEILDSKDIEKSSNYFRKEVEESFFVYENYISNFISIHKAEVASYNISISKQVKYFDLDYQILGLPVLYYFTAFYFICAFIYLFFLTKFILKGLHKKID